MAESQHANTNSVNVKPRVFRVRNLPSHVDRLSAVELLSQSINGITTQDIRLSSLAYDVDVWSWLRTKTATITLHMRPPDLSSILSHGECTISVPGLAKPLIIDHHFQGVTPLNHVPDNEHKYDCLVISGLSSHPFGSWQTHGHDKSFMWIRDELPHRLPGVRFLTYGYDTTLSASTSFQLIPDLAISLVHTLKAIGWSTPSAKPVLFLAHSLGGVVLKQALAILAGGGSEERSILVKIQGAIFFGVPSQGMSIPDIFKMLGDQPNVALVKDLSDQSDFLPRLDEQFGNISYLQRLQFFWAFETKVTPSVEVRPLLKQLFINMQSRAQTELTERQKAVTTGKFARTGPGTVMVSRESATRNFCHLRPASTIQVDENHSDMVKFGTGDKYIGIFASKLEDICALSGFPVSQPARGLTRNPSQHELAGPTATSDQPRNIGKGQAQKRSNFRPECTMQGFWDGDEILSSLRAPERDRRLEQIDQKLGDTFNWAYDNTSAGLSEWLRKGTGIFWIHGKPGSGKSTLMKYLYQDPRTEELLRAGGWQSRARLMTASFFFHHRGNIMERSFEGLMRSLVSQILEQERSLSPLLDSILDNQYPILANQYRTIIASARLDSLEEDIRALLRDLHIPWSSDVMNKVEEIVALQREMTQNGRLGMHLRRTLKELGVKSNSRSGDPFEEVEFSDSKFISMAAVDRQSSEEQEAPSKSSKTRNWLMIMGRTLQRHYQREKVRTDIQAALWTRANLEECLRLLIGQSLFKMDLFLFLDGLDEYDGRPEFIASFLQDLVRQPVDRSKQSMTVVRILFSSRPWKALNDEFAACPGFQIQDHTENDIIEFCAASIPSDGTSMSFLSPFVMEIVRRARGVFLWVGLVIRDLAKIVLRRAQLRNTQELEHELRKTLDAIPDELHDYYQLILQRIPPFSRWDTYVVLETLCRSDEDMDIETLVDILNCATAKSVAHAELKRTQYFILHGSGWEWGEQYIKAVSGGLVELGGLSETGKPIFQFMHHTVKQFVEGPWFKLQLLGNNIGMFVTENGHSFIAKHLFVDSRFTNRFVRHAREAETTMGFSQYEFFSTASRQHYPPMSSTFPYHLTAIIELSALAGLQLCVRDSCDADPSCIRERSVHLIRVLLEAAATGQWGVSTDSVINMAELLVLKGLSIHEIDVGLLSVVQRMWSVDRVLRPAFENLSLIFLDAMQTKSTPPTTSPSSGSTPNQSTTLHSSSLVTTVLHQATPKLVRALLARGFIANSLDYVGHTPMDCVLHLNSPLSLPEKYDIVSQLVCHGGLLRLTRRSRWNEFEATCAGSGLDTTVFREAGFPLWHSSRKPARKHRSLGRFLSQFI